MAVSKNNLKKLQDYLKSTEKSNLDFPIFENMTLAEYEAIPAADKYKYRIWEINTGFVPGMHNITISNEKFNINLKNT